MLQPLSFTLIRVMREIDRKVDKERLPLVPFDKRARFTREQIRKKLAVVMNLFAVAVQVMHIWSRPIKEVRVIINAPAHMAERIVESLRIRHLRRRVSQMPFPKM